MSLSASQYALKKVLAQQLDWHGARISFLAHFMIALFQVKTVNLADREFVGQQWFTYLQRQGIAFRIRIKHNTLIPNHWNKLFPVRALLGPLKPGEQRVLAGRRPLWGCFLHIVALGLDDGQLLILVTTDRLGCLKSRGFRFEDTHLTHPDRISKLIALLALAFVWAYRVGEIHSQRQPIPFKKPSSDRSSRCSAMASIESASYCSMSSTNAPLSSAS